MDRIELQIYNNVSQSYLKADIDRFTDFSFNLNKFDLENPTVTKVNFSKQISLPRTPQNDRIFGEIWRLDSVVYDFDPIKRTNFRLYIENDLFESGIFKLESVSDTYSVRLFGGLAELFYQMSQRKLKDMDFGINERGFYSHKIDRNFVYNCWTGAPALNMQGYDISDFLTYVMTYQGDYENFDNKNVMQGSSSNATINEVTWTNPRNNQQYTKPDLNEHRRTFQRGSSTYYFGEYRSYYQKPALKLRNIFTKIWTDMQTEEGWVFNLDDTFFDYATQVNPYFHDVWCVMPEYKPTDDINYENGRYTNTGTVLSITERGSSSVAQLQFANSNTGNADLGMIRTDQFKITSDTKYNGVKVSLPFRIKVTDVTGDAQNRDYYFTSDKANKDLKKLHVRGLVGPSSGSATPLFDQETGEPHYELNIDTVEPFNPTLHEYLTRKGKGYSGTIGDGNKGGEGTIFYLEADISYSGYDRTYNIYSTLEYFNNEVQNTVLYTDGGRNHRFTFHLEPVNDIDDAIQAIGNASIRTGSVITWTDIMKSEATYLDFFLSYCNIFGLIFTKDKYNKNIYVETRNTFYNDLIHEDWTTRQILNRQREESFPFDYRAGIFRWVNAGTKYEEDYLNRTNREFGSFRFDNGYEYTDTEQEYLQKQLFNNVITASDYGPYYVGRTDDEILKDNKILPFFEDNSGSRSDISFALIFRNGLKEVETPFIISDDHPTMAIEGYCFNEVTSYVTACSKYPNLTKSIGKDNGVIGKISSLNFGRPRIVYNNDDKFEVSDGNDDTGEETIYAQFWRSYLRDRYDRNAKLLTAYFDLRGIKVDDTLFKRFILIDNSCWTVNRVINYNPLRPESVQVELIRVQDPKNYIGQTFLTPA